MTNGDEPHSGCAATVPVNAGRQELLSESELLDKCSVSLDVLLRKITEQLLSVTDHLGETSLRMEVLRVLLHMLGKDIYSVREYSDLNLGRTGVSLVDLVLAYYGGLCLLGNHLILTFLYYSRNAVHRGDNADYDGENPAPEQGLGPHRNTGPFKSIA